MPRKQTHEEFVQDIKNINPTIKIIGKYQKAKEVEIYSPKEFAISIDGEIIRNDYFKITIEEKAIRLLVPQE